MDKHRSTIDKKILLFKTLYSFIKDVEIPEPILTKSPQEPSQQSSQSVGTITSPQFTLLKSPFQSNIPPQDSPQNSVPQPGNNRKVSSDQPPQSPLSSSSSINQPLQSQLSVSSQQPTPQSENWTFSSDSFSSFENFKTMMSTNMGEINQENLLKLCFLLGKRMNDKLEESENVYQTAVLAKDEGTQMEKKKKRKRNEREKKLFSYRIKYSNQEKWMDLEEADRDINEHLKVHGQKYFCNFGGNPCKETGSYGWSISVRDHIRRHIGLKLYCFYCRNHRGTFNYQGLTRHFQTLHWDLGMDPKEKTTDSPLNSLINNNSI